MTAKALIAVMTQEYVALISVVGNIDYLTQRPKRYSNRDRVSYPQAGRLFFLSLFCVY